MLGVGRSNGKRNAHFRDRERNGTVSGLFHRHTKRCVKLSRPQGCQTNYSQKWIFFNENTVVKTSIGGGGGRGGPVQTKLFVTRCFGTGFPRSERDGKEGIIRNATGSNLSAEEQNGTEWNTFSKSPTLECVQRDRNALCAERIPLDMETT